MAEEKKDTATSETAEGRKAKNKKINKMTLAEIEEKLKTIQESMGSHGSKYAWHLLKRKETLESKG